MYVYARMHVLPRTQRLRLCVCVCDFYSFLLASLPPFPSLFPFSLRTLLMITILAWPALFVAIHLLERWPQMSSRRSVMVGFIVFHHFFLFFFAVYMSIGCVRVRGKTNVLAPLCHGGFHFVSSFLFDFSLLFLIILFHHFYLSFILFHHFSLVSHCFFLSFFILFLLLSESNDK